MACLFHGHIYVIASTATYMLYVITHTSVLGLSARGVPVVGCSLFLTHLVLCPAFHAVR